MEQNKTGKYLKYAIGEIVLVVIGILIALQINNWNENRKNYKLQKVYLNRLIQDLEEDLNDLESVMEAEDIISVLSVDALSILGEDTSYVSNNESYKMAKENVTINNGQIIHQKSMNLIEIGSFGVQLSLLTQQRYFDLALATYNDLISTGNIEIIEDQELRNIIQTHYAWMIANLDFQEFVVRPFSIDYRQTLKEYGIVPNSRMKIQEIKNLNEKDRKLVTAIYYLLESNFQFINISYRSSNSFHERILNMKSKLEAAINKM